MTPYFRRFTLLLVAMCLVATWSVVVTSQTAEEDRARAEAGDAGAQYNLGVACAEGRGVPHVINASGQSLVQSISWRQRSLQRRQ